MDSLNGDELNHSMSMIDNKNSPNYVARQVSLTKDNKQLPATSSRSNLSYINSQKYLRDQVKRSDVSILTYRKEAIKNSKTIVGAVDQSQSFTDR